MAFSGEYMVPIEDAQKLERELAEVTKQRDQLVNALRNCREDSVEILSERSWWQNEPRCDYQTRYAETAKNIRKADSALAAAEGGQP